MAGVVEARGITKWFGETTALDQGVPYPGDKKILPPSQVPGHNLPADYLGD